MHGLYVGALVMTDIILNASSGLAAPPKTCSSFCDCLALQRTEASAQRYVTAGRSTSCGDVFFFFCGDFDRNALYGCERVGGSRRISSQNTSCRCDFKIMEDISGLVNMLVRKNM